MCKGQNDIDSKMGLKSLTHTWHEKPAVVASTVAHQKLILWGCSDPKARKKPKQKACVGVPRASCCDKRSSGNTIIPNKPSSLFCVVINRNDVRKRAVTAIWTVAVDSIRRRWKKIRWDSNLNAVRMTRKWPECYTNVFVGCVTHLPASSCCVHSKPNSMNPNIKRQSMIDKLAIDLDDRNRLVQRWSNPIHSRWRGRHLLKNVKARLRL